MTKANMTLSIFLSVLILSAAFPLAAQTSISGQQDIASLLERARQTFDLDQEEAVFLFAGRKELWLPDGRLTTMVHEIVWINSEYAIDRYADRRIPYDHENRTFQAVTVRTWRDGQWWETGESGRVETLPYAVRTAYDYTTVREMMLLHNGVEVPCVLEVAYIIEDKEAYRSGADGFWSFQKNEPVVESWFIHGVPAGTPPHVVSHQEAPEPERGVDSARGIDTYAFKMIDLPASGRPDWAGAALRRPHVRWSTWSGWNGLAERIGSRLVDDAELPEAVVTDFDSLRGRARTDAELVAMVADYVGDKVRRINYPETFWWHQPRSAAEVYATAYGHRLDRAVFAKALLEAAGLPVRPVLIADYRGGIVPKVPSLNWSDGVSLRIPTDQADLVYDPGSGSVRTWRDATMARVAWDMTTSEEPVLNEAGSPGAYEVRLDIDIDESGALQARGLLRCTHAMFSYGQAVGVAGDLKGLVSRVATSLIDGAELDAFNPYCLDPESLVVAFECSLDSVSRDSLGRYQLVFAEPNGGVLDVLPGDIRLHHQTRTSSVFLSAPLAQRIEVNLSTENIDLVYYPSSAIDIAMNGARYTGSTELGESRLSLFGECVLSRTEFGPEAWPELRSCLTPLVTPAQHTVKWRLRAASK